MNGTDTKTALKRIPHQLRKSLTYDRGKEMALHEVLTKKTNVKVCFADPHSPWQRGAKKIRKA
jgi:transposase, IS30 family